MTADETALVMALVERTINELAGMAVIWPVHAERRKVWVRIWEKMRRW